LKGDKEIMTGKRINSLVMLIALIWGIMWFAEPAWAGQPARAAQMMEWWNELNRQGFYIINVAKGYKPPFGRIKSISIKGTERYFWIADQRAYNQYVEQIRRTGPKEQLQNSEKARNNDGRNRDLIKKELWGNPPTVEWLKDVFINGLIDKWKHVTFQKHQTSPRAGFIEFYDGGKNILEGLRTAGTYSLNGWANVFGKDVHTPTIYNSYGGNGPKAIALMDMCSEIDNAVTRANNGQQLEKDIANIRKNYWDIFRKIGGPGPPWN
jgi:hypothetical protein